VFNKISIFLINKITKWIQVKKMNAAESKKGNQMATSFDIFRHTAG